MGARIYLETEAFIARDRHERTGTGKEQIDFFGRASSFVINVVNRDVQCDDKSYIRLPYNLLRP